MRLNPEFRRHLWLDLSLQRLIAMPAILGAIFFLVQLTDQDSLFQLTDQDSGPLIGVGSWLFTLLVLFWGTRLAAAAVTTEVRDGTWDWQRMSAIGPWQMTWGKLFGSTVFVWYGALIALGVSAAALAFESRSGQIPSLLFFNLAGGILAHAVSLSASLLWLRRGKATGRAALVLPQFLGLIAGMIVAVQADVFIDGGFSGSLTWYGVSFDLRHFLVLSVSIFLAWAVLSVYRLMQAELQVRQRPWAWAGFVVFLALYYGGIPMPLEEDLSFAPGLLAHLMAGFLATLGLAYVSMFIFSKDVIGLRGLRLALTAGDTARALRLLPPWLAGAAMVLIAGLAVIVALLLQDRVFGFLPETGSGADADLRLTAVVLILGTLLYLLRDLGIVVLLNLRATRKRADAAALVYLGVLHVLAPALLVTLGQSDLVSLVSPFASPSWAILVVGAITDPDAGVVLGAQLGVATVPWLMIFGAAAQVALVLVLLGRRWQRFQAEFETGIAPNPASAKPVAPTGQAG